MIDVLVRADVHIFSLAILAVVFFTLRRLSDTHAMQTRLFRYMIGTTALILAACAVSQTVAGVEGGFARFVHTVVMVVYFVLEPFPGMLTLVYTDYHIRLDGSRSHRILVRSTYLLTANALVALSSVVTGAYFFIDTANVLHRGPLFPLHVAMCYIFAPAVLVGLYRHRRTVNRTLAAVILVYGALPAVAGIFQAALPGLMIAWPALAVSILVMFVYLQANSLDIDFLTGIDNRRHFEIFLRSVENSLADDDRVLLFMMDLDNLKTINDTFGHPEGDAALIVFASVLRRCFRGADVIARYGGDEFVVAARIRQGVNGWPFVDRMAEALEECNRAETRYILSASIGWGVYDPEEGMSPTQFFHKVDREMYAEKERKKRAQASCR